jgi:hypothetical protein
VASVTSRIIHRIPSVLINEWTKTAVCKQVSIFYSVPFHCNFLRIKKLKFENHKKFLKMATTSKIEQKLILCGDYGVGKSSLFRRYMNGGFISSVDRSVTLGKLIFLIKLNDYHDPIAIIYFYRIRSLFKNIQSER